MPRKGQGRVIGRPVTRTIPSPAGGVKLETFIPWTLVKRGVKKEMITPIEALEAFPVDAVQEHREQKTARETPLVRALGLAHYWQHLLDSGKFGALTEIAAAEGLDLGQVSRIVRLTRLAPWAVEACVWTVGSGDWGVQWSRYPESRRLGSRGCSTLNRYYYVGIIPY